MLAYNLEAGPKGSGDYYIDVYDPNRPFNYQGSETSQGDHLSVLTASRIYVDPAGKGSWSFTGAGGGAYGGDMGSLLVISDSLATQSPNFPSGVSGLAQIVFGSTEQAGHGDAAISVGVVRARPHIQPAGGSVAAERRPCRTSHPAWGPGRFGVRSEPANQRSLRLLLPARITAFEADAVFQNMGLKYDFRLIG